MFAACGGTALTPPPVVALKVSGCAFSGSLQSTTMAGAPIALSAGQCGGGIFDGGGQGAGIDLDLVLVNDYRNGEGVSLTFNRASANTTLQIVDAPADIASDNFLASSVPPGVIWVRHRSESSTSLDQTYTGASGSVVLGAIGLSTPSCSKEACSEGTASFDIAFQDVTWPGKSAPRTLNGHVVVTVSAGDPSCKGSSDCQDGLACNRVTFLAQNGSYGCGPTNAGGADLGAACTTATDCQSNVCDSEAGQCTVFCSATADCTNGTACMESNKGPALAACVRACTSDADCAGLPKAAICVAHDAAGSTTLVGGCGGAIGTKTFGQSSGMDGGDVCDSGLSANKTCTRICRVDADCAPPLPVCSKTSGLRSCGL